MKDVIHMGSIVRKVALEKGVTFASIAKKIDIGATAMTAVFKKPHIDSGRLKQLSEILDHDFFQYYTTNQGKSVVSEEAVPYKTEAPKTEKEGISIVVNLDGTKEQLQKWVSRLEAINKLAMI